MRIHAREYRGQQKTVRTDGMVEGSKPSRNARAPMNHLDLGFGTVISQGLFRNSNLG